MSVHYIHGNGPNGSNNTPANALRDGKHDSVRVLAQEVHELRRELQGRRISRRQRFATVALDGAAWTAGAAIVSALACGIQCGVRALMKA